MPLTNPGHSDPTRFSVTVSGCLVLREHRRAARSLALRLGLVTDGRYPHADALRTTNSDEDTLNLHFALLVQRMRARKVQVEQAIAVMTTYGLSKIDQELRSPKSRTDIPSSH